MYLCMYIVFIYIYKYILYIIYITWGHYCIKKTTRKNIIIK